MQKLLYPLKVIAAIFLAIISVFLRILGPFAGFITGVLGMVGLIISIIVDLGAVMVTFLWITGMKSTTGMSMGTGVIFTWIIAFLLTSICFGGVVFGGNVVDLGEKAWDLAKRLLGLAAPINNSSYVNSDYYSQQETLENISSGDAEEIYKFKKLLEMGAITQEEFETKKNQILNR